MAAARQALGEKDEAAPAARAGRAARAALSATTPLAALDEAVRADWVGVALDDDRADGALFGLAHALWAYDGERLLRLEGDAADAALARLLREGARGRGRRQGRSSTRSPPRRFLQARAPLSPARSTPRASSTWPWRPTCSTPSAAPSAPAELAEAYLAETLPAASEELPEAALDAIRARLLVPALSERMERDGATGLFQDMEMPLLPVLAEMERVGLGVDVSVLAAQSAELGAEIEGMVERIHAEAGEDFNIDSPQQLSHVLFDVLGLPTYGLKRTKRGFYSTNAKVLGDLAADHAIVAEVLDYRERSKIKSTYLDALPALVAGDGRIHTTLNQTVTATGRLSSSDPNLQNIPTRSELGHRVRQAFTVPEGSVFLACDYSQIELRLLAHLSGGRAPHRRLLRGARLPRPPRPRASSACRWRKSRRSCAAAPRP